MRGECSALARLAGAGLLLVGGATCMEFGFPECRVACETNADCAAGLMCSEAGLCGRARDACGVDVSEIRGPDLPAPVNVAAPSDAGVRPDAEAPPEVVAPPDVPGPSEVVGPLARGDAGPDATVELPPEPLPDPSGCPLVEPRPERLCLGESCLELSSAMRDSLGLWLEPTSLGEPGSTLSVWCDRSGQRNHGYPGAEGPLSTPLEVMIDASRPGANAELQRSVWLRDNWLYLDAEERLNFGTSDLLVLFVMSVLTEEDLAAEQPTASTTLFLASGLGRYSLMVWAQPPPTAGVQAFIDDGSPIVVNQDWDLFDARSRLHGLSRIGELFDYRLNGQSEGRSPIPATLDLSSPENIAGFGSSDVNLITSYASTRLSAALIFRGTLEPEDIQRTEQFLCDSLDGCIPVQ